MLFVEYATAHVPGTNAKPREGTVHTDTTYMELDAIEYTHPCKYATQQMVKNKSEHGDILKNLIPQNMENIEWTHRNSLGRSEKESRGLDQNDIALPGPCPGANG